MANGKVTLAELRKEAERVGAGEVNEGYVPHSTIQHCWVNYVEVVGKSRMQARRRMLKLLRALPDGALKEG